MLCCYGQKCVRRFTDPFCPLVPKLPVIALFFNSRSIIKLLIGVKYRCEEQTSHAIAFDKRCLDGNNRNGAFASAARVNRSLPSNAICLSKPAMKIVPPSSPNWNNSRNLPFLHVSTNVPAAIPYRWNCPASNIGTNQNPVPAAAAAVRWSRSVKTYCSLADFAHDAKTGTCFCTTGKALYQNGSNCLTKFCKRLVNPVLSFWPFTETINSFANDLHVSVIVCRQRVDVASRSRRLRIPSATSPALRYR